MVEADFQRDCKWGCCVDRSSTRLALRCRGGAGRPRRTRTPARGRGQGGGGGRRHRPSGGSVGDERARNAARQCPSAVDARRRRRAQADRGRIDKRSARARSRATSVLRSHSTRPCMRSSAGRRRRTHESLRRGLWGCRVAVRREPRPARRRRGVGLRRLAGACRRDQRERAPADGRGRRRRTSTRDDRRRGIASVRLRNRRDEGHAYRRRDRSDRPRIHGRSSRDRAERRRQRGGRRSGTSRGSFAARRSLRERSSSPASCSGT